MNLSASALAAIWREEALPRCAPLVFRDPEEYAAGIKVPDGLGGITRMRFDKAPYQRQPYLDLFNPDLREVVLRWFSRGGKTRIVTTAIGYRMEESPEKMAVMYPSLTKCAEFKKTTLQQELINCNRSLLKLLGDGSSRRNSRNTVYRIEYPGGLLKMLSAGSPGDIRQTNGSFLYADEIDAIKTELTDEGDQLAQFDKRRDEYPRSMMVVSSYPSVLGLSKIDARLESSDWQKWFVGCKCGHEYVMHWDQAEWPSGEPEKAVLVCPQCAQAIDDKDRRRMMLDGEWRATREFTGVRGYDANSTLWPWPTNPKSEPGGYIQRYAKKVETAKRSDNPSRSMRAVINHEHAESYEREGSERPEKHWLLSNREQYQPEVMIPEGVLMIGAGADLQGDRIETEIIGFGANRETWGLGYHVLHGKHWQASAWNKWREFFAGLSFNHPSAGKLGLDFLCFDCGWKSDTVIPALRNWSRSGTITRRRGIWPVKGSGQVDDPIWRVSKDRKRRAFMMVGVNECKDVVWQRLNLVPQSDEETEAEGEQYPTGYCHFPVSGMYDEHYFRMLTESEDPTPEKGRDGNYYTRFVVKESGGTKARNEALDIRAYALAGEARMKPDYAKLKEARCGKKDEESSQDNEQKPNTPAARGRARTRIRYRRGFGGRGTNFVTGY